MMRDMKAAFHLLKRASLCAEAAGKRQFIREGKLSNLRASRV
jgi:hypothetical protein